MSEPVYRVVKMGSKVYAMQVNIKRDISNILEFVLSGEVVILCDDLESLDDYGIDVSRVEIVEPE